MPKRVPGMFLVAFGVLAIAVGLAYGAYTAFGHGTPGMRFLGKLLALAAFLTFMLAIACIVLAFGVDFR